MKTLYFDCSMGAAGDMLTAALLELIPDQEEFIAQLNALGIPGIAVSRERMSKCGIGGTHITVRVHGEEETEDMHDHTHPHDSHEHEHSHEAGAGKAAASCHELRHHHDHAHGTAHPHHHSGMHDITHIVHDLPVSDKVRKDILAVYG